MLVPWATSTGTLIGAVAGAALSGLVSFGIQFASAAKQIVPHTLPVAVESCDIKYGLNITYTPPVITLLIIIRRLHKNFVILITTL